VLFISVLVSAAIRAISPTKAFVVVSTVVLISSELICNLSSIDSIELKAIIAAF
jgi:hypothetical protein